ncbi:MAG: HEAT repeat domain-containing protein [Gemmataceae bacterium]|nr:HEAT repeat domain-containing protein [Gemmataceae bacterium]
MRWCRYFLVGAVVLAAATPARAGIFGKRQKHNPAQHVPELVQTLRQERDDRKRAAAAEDLRQYDPNQFPEIVPALIHALQTDPKPAVRIEAAQALGKLRPVSVPAGKALEKAASDDGSLRVRLQARTQLMFYHLAGYNGRKEGPHTAPGPKTEEPPLAGQPPVVSRTPSSTTPSPIPPPGAITREPPFATIPPPTAPPPTAVGSPDLPRPLPLAPPLQPAPMEGPVLVPPQ